MEAGFETRPYRQPEGLGRFLGGGPGPPIKLSTSEKWFRKVRLEHQLISKLPDSARPDTNLFIMYRRSKG